jgi:hypothetical protein
VALQEFDEWTKKLPDGKKIRYSYQLLTTGFSASMEILALDAMIYTHTHTDLLPPVNRAQIEAEFADELAKVDTHRRGDDAPFGRYRSAS